MLGWLYSHLLTFLTYLIAPIIFHTNCDSYILLFIFTILELSDTFTGYRIYILFVFAGLLLRNYLFNVFKSSSILNKSGEGKILPVENNLKNLIIRNFTLSKTLFSKPIRF
jgi:hypothetical protein